MFVAYGNTNGPSAPLRSGGHGDMKLATGPFGLPMRLPLLGLYCSALSQERLSHRLCTPGWLFRASGREFRLRVHTFQEPAYLEEIKVVQVSSCVLLRPLFLGWVVACLV